MKKLNLTSARIYGMLVLVLFTNLFSPNKETLAQETTHKVLFHKTVKFLESKGLKVLQQVQPLRSPRILDTTQTEGNAKDFLKVAVQFKLPKAKKSAIHPQFMNKRFVESKTAYDTLLTEDFETGKIDTTKWQLLGNSTWGATNYRKHNGAYSAWCAAGGDSALSPNENYPNNCDSWMIYGPFDLRHATLSFLKFYFCQDTQPLHDYFCFGASIDGENFISYAISGSTNNKWLQECLNLGNVPLLGDLTGRDSVWIAFRFVSDSIGTDKGVFVDNVELFKGTGGSGLSGWISGTLTKEKSPYVACWEVGVNKADSLIIEPGVKIYFENSYNLIVYGSLHSVGTEIDSIVFSSSSEKWGSIEFIDTKINNNIKYSIIENGSSNIYCNLSKVNIENCSIGKGDTGIESDGSQLLIKNNKILYPLNKRWY